MTDKGTQFMFRGKRNVDDIQDIKVASDKSNG